MQIFYYLCRQNFRPWIMTNGNGKAYQQRLADAGVTVEWVPLESLIDGYGAAHCMTQVLKRY